MTGSTDGQTMGNDVNVRELVDGAPLGALQWRVIIICFLTAVFDGLDNQAIGFAAPAIASDLGIPLSSFGVVFSAGLIGGMIGAMTMGMVADKIGRKSALLLCTILFGVFTVATAYSTGSFELVVFRLFAGFGLGGAMPCFLTMVAEYAPKARRGFIMAVLWCGYPTGGMIGGAIGSVIVPAYGWHSIFLLGGALSIAIGLIQWLLLPESLLFLALKSGDPARIGNLARRVDPARALSDARFFAEAPVRPAKIPIVDLFAQGRAPLTLLLWVIMFCTFMITSFFVLWSPGLLRQSGVSIASAAMMIAVLNFSNLPSQAASGYMIDKVGPFRLLPWGYLALALMTGLLAFSTGAGLGAGLGMAAIMGAIGFLQGPGIAGSVYLATRMYPAHIRSTGSGWATSVGRSGQVFGSLLIGALVASAMPPSWIFLLMCVPPLIAAAGVILLGRRISQEPL